MDDTGLRKVESGMNAKSSLLRSMIAFSAVAGLLTMNGASLAANTTAVPHHASAETELSSLGFLDYKTLIFSPDTGDNLDGVFNQIQLIGPDMFRSATLRPEVLEKFKRGQTIFVPTNPSLEQDEHGRNILKLDVFRLNPAQSDMDGGEPSASSDLIDAILTDITDNIRNHGVSWKTDPGAGPETANYLQSATQRVLHMIGQLEGTVTSENVGAHLGDHGAPPGRYLSNLTPIFLAGLSLVIFGLIWRFARRKTLKAATTNPKACFEAIKRSPIRLKEKTQ